MKKLNRRLGAFIALVALPFIHSFSCFWRGLQAFCDQTGDEDALICYPWLWHCLKTGEHIDVDTFQLKRPDEDRLD